jgi:hypothetical protein
MKMKKIYFPALLQISPSLLVTAALSGEISIRNGQVMVIGNADS